jgi:hypothetical protein
MDRELLSIFVGISEFKVRVCCVSLSYVPEVNFVPKKVHIRRNELRGPQKEAGSAPGAEGQERAEKKGAARSWRSSLPEAAALTCCRGCCTANPPAAAPGWRGAARAVLVSLLEDGQEDETQVSGKKWACGGRVNCKGRGHRSEDLRVIEDEYSNARSLMLSLK